MTPDLQRRLEALEVRAGIGKVRTVWDGGQDITAAIAEMVACGRAAVDDKVVIVGWLEGGPEAEMHPDPSRAAPPHRDAPPPADNDSGFWGPLCT